MAVNKSDTDLSPQQALYVLRRAIADRKLSRVDVNRYLKGVGQEISEMENRLAELRGMRPAGTSGRRRGPGRPAGGGKARKGRGRAAKKKRSGKAVSPEVQKSRQLQGRYLGLLRQVPERERGKFKKIAQNDSREKAVDALAKRLGK